MMVRRVRASLVSLVVVVLGALAVSGALALADSAAAGGAFVELPVSCGGGIGGVRGIAAGPDGNLWFTGTFGKVGRISPVGSASCFSLSNPNIELSGIAVGSDGNLWFSEEGGHSVGRTRPPAQ